MKVMTFNIRYENEIDGSNGWEQRRTQVVRLINRYTPDVLGTQEGKRSQLLYLVSSLSSYRLCSKDRLWDDNSQYPTLFTEENKFEVKENGEFWLSKTPAVHLSKDWGSAFPRMMNYARLQVKENKRSLWVVVTHLDNVGAKARYEQGRLLAQWVRSKKEPVILMGDFNDNPGSCLYKMLTAPETGLIDTWEKSGGGEGPESFTHHGFKGSPQQSRMDWILASSHFTISDAAIIRDNEKGAYPSDHFPYLVEVEF
ncbi:MAG: endonuclease/exonuclease/phosphatase family protein [Syntrophales bacterium]|jgi:endonuclease/exonuclease/phosphatase family metal-dependent hydrolase|nr:endonuclease/exonuclease/phosphatase family protein [Syntrophales bacterium]MDY0045055.1 endonuclease/exonuclease/phosphatase family protein [Syntrophales bacterium]